MTIRNHVDFLVKNAELAHAEDLELQKKHNIDTTVGINVGDENVIEWAFEKNTQEEKADKYLSEIDTEVLIKIQAIMYFGRGDSELPYLLKHFKEMKESKEVIIMTILEKRTAYTKYFAAAMSKLRDSGLDINNI